MLGELSIDECARCEGLFLDEVAIRRIIDDRRQAEALAGELPRREVRVVPRAGEKMYLKCPACRTVMNRRQFATGAGVVVDVCKQHGTFFDAGELPAIIDYVMAGGLERSAKKDREHARQQIARDREQHAAMARASARADAMDAMDRGGALVDLLIALFG